MGPYLELIDRLLKEGAERADRTGVGTHSLFGAQMRFDLAKGFPLVTTKKVHLRSIIYELLWFLRAGDRLNTDYLQAHHVSIWDEWADRDGDLGPLYGSQWNAWRGADGNRYDQLQRVLDDIETNPHSRRLVVSAWNVGELKNMRLWPCHVLFQFYVTGDQRLSCQLYQRSADAFLGLPFNIASYALLTMMMAQVARLAPGEFIHTLGDVHLYKNHVAQARLQLKRKPYPLPVMRLNSRVKALKEFEYADFELVNYQYHPAIKAPIAI